MTGKNDTTQYESAVEKLAEGTESYGLTQEQFYLCMINDVGLLTEKNSFLNAQQQVLQSK